MLSADTPSAVWQLATSTVATTIDRSAKGAIERGQYGRSLRFRLHLGADWLAAAAENRWLFNLRQLSVQISAVACN